MHFDFKSPYRQQFRGMKYRENQWFIDFAYKHYRYRRGPFKDYDDAIMHYLTLLEFMMGMYPKDKELEERFYYIYNCYDIDTDPDSTLPEDVSLALDGRLTPFARERLAMA